MRCFIGLDLSATEKLALDSWRQQALPEVMPRQWVKSESPRSRKSANKRYDHNSSQGPALPYAVPAANFHITLSFLGEINHRQHEALIYELDQLVNEPFSLTLDATGLWNGPKYSSRRQQRRQRH